MGITQPNHTNLQMVYERPTQVFLLLKQGGQRKPDWSKFNIFTLYGYITQTKDSEKLVLLIVVNAFYNTCDRETRCCTQE